jgi:hypothetical protein
MVIAALVCFAVLLVAWIVAPADGRRRDAPPVEAARLPDLEPLLEAA